MIHHFLSRQFVVFLAVGGTAAAVNWLARWLFRHWTSYGVAVALAYGCGFVAGFLLSRRYVFPGSSRPVSVQAREVLLVNLAWFPVVWITSLLLAPQLLHWGAGHWSEGIAHGIATGLPAFGSFLIYKLHTFR